MIPRGVARPLPNRRVNRGIDVKFRGGVIHFGIGFFEDGQPAEIFIDSSKVGSELRETMIALAKLVSLSLQYGSPIGEIVHILRDGSDTSIPAELAKILQEYI